MIDTTSRVETESTEHLRQRSDYFCHALKQIFEITSEQAVAAIALDALKMRLLWEQTDTS